MAYQQGKTIVKQSAVKAASELVSAAMAGGLITSFEDGISEFGKLRDDIFKEMVVLVDEDNATYTASGGSSGGGYKRNYSSSGSSSGGGGSVSLESALDTAMKYGWAGPKDGPALTLRQIAAMDEAACRERGYGSDERPKTGLDYIKWLAENAEKNAYMSRRAAIVLESLKDQAE